MSKVTGNQTHIATRTGFSTDGVLVAEGEFVPAGTPLALAPDEDNPSDDDLANGWMKPVKGAERALMGAIDEALDPFNKDIDYTQLGVAALQAMAAERGIDAGGLSKKDLIAAIKAAHDPTR